MRGRSSPLPIGAPPRVKDSVNQSEIDAFNERLVARAKRFGLTPGHSTQVSPETRSVLQTPRNDENAAQHEVQEKEEIETSNSIDIPLHVSESEAEVYWPGFFISSLLSAPRTPEGPDGELSDEELLRQGLPIARAVSSAVDWVYREEMHERLQARARRFGTGQSSSRQTEAGAVRRCPTPPKPPAPPKPAPDMGEEGNGVQTRCERRTSNGTFPWRNTADKGRAHSEEESLPAALRQLLGRWESDDDGKIKLHEVSCLDGGKIACETWDRRDDGTSTRWHNYQVTKLHMDSGSGHILWSKQSRNTEERIRLDKRESSPDYKVWRSDAGKLWHWHRLPDDEPSRSGKNSRERSRSPLAHPVRAGESLSTRSRAP